MFKKSHDIEYAEIQKIPMIFIVSFISLNMNKISYNEIEQKTMYQRVLA